MNQMKNDEEFIEFLVTTCRWNEADARKYKDDLRKEYFPNLSTMARSEIEERMATVSVKSNISNYPAR